MKILQGRLISPTQILQKKSQSLQISLIKLNSGCLRGLENRRARLEKGMSLLESLSPLKVVERGYSVTLKEGRLVKDSQQLVLGDRVEVKLMNGSFEAEVKKIETKNWRSYEF